MLGAVLSKILPTKMFNSEATSCVQLPPFSRGAAKAQSSEGTQSDAGILALHLH